MKEGSYTLGDCRAVKRYSPEPMMFAAFFVLPDFVVSADMTPTGISRVWIERESSELFEVTPTLAAPGNR